MGGGPGAPHPPASLPGQADSAAAPQGREEGRHLPLRPRHPGLGNEEPGEARGRGAALSGGGQTRRRGLRAHPSPLLRGRSRSSWRRSPLCCCWPCCAGWTGPSTPPSTPSATTPSCSTPSAVSASRRHPPAKFPPRFFQLCHLLLGSTLWPCNPTVATGPPRPTPFVSAAGRGGKSAAEGRGGFSALTSPRPLHTDFPDTRPAPL